MHISGKRNLMIGETVSKPIKSYGCTDIKSILALQFTSVLTYTQSFGVGEFEKLHILPRYAYIRLHNIMGSHLSNNYSESQNKYKIPIRICEINGSVLPIILIKMIFTTGQTSHISNFMHIQNIIPYELIP